MTLERKLLIGAGLAVIVGMLMIACFSVGVYVGDHGLSGSALSLQPPDAGGVPPAGGGGQGWQGQQPVPGGGRPPDLLGRVREIGQNGLQLATQDGPRIVGVDSETLVQTLEGDEGSLEDIEVGQIVAVFGRRVNGGNVLFAELIVVIPEQAPGQ